MTIRWHRFEIASIMLVLFIICPVCCCAGRLSDEASSAYGPWGYARSSAELQSLDGADPVSDAQCGVPEAFVMKMIGLFSRYISKVDGDRCAMYPTCASYGMQAVRKYGALISIVMISDRLIHEGNEMDSAPLVEVGGKMRLVPS